MVPHTRHNVGALLLSPPDFGHLLLTGKKKKKGKSILCINSRWQKDSKGLLNNYTVNSDTDPGNFYFTETCGSFAGRDDNRHVPLTL